MKTQKRIVKSMLALCGIAALLVMTAQKSRAGDAAYDADVDNADHAVVHLGLDEISGTTAANDGSAGATDAGTYGSSTGLGVASLPNLGTQISSPSGNIGVSGNYADNTGDITAEAWVDPTNLGGYQLQVFNLLDDGSSGDSGISVGIEGSTFFFFDNAESNAGFNGQSSFTAIVGTEYLVDFVRSGGVDTLYVDGHSVLTTAGFVNASNMDTVDDTLGFENYTVNEPNPGSPATGSVDEFAVYNGALSAAQIMATYELGSGPLVSATPEPSTWAMMFLGLGAVAFVIRRRRLNS